LRAVALAGLFLVAQAGWASPLLAVVAGMVMDNRAGRAFLFDAETGAVTASVPFGPNYQGTGDCLMLGDRGPAFATDFNSRIWAFDLETTPAALAPPPNPIRISNPGEDLALSPDGRFLVICDGNGPAPVSVVDIAARREVGTLDLGSDCNAVDVCDDGSVLVSSIRQRLIRRLVLSPDGTLVDTGESIAAGSPMNVDCAPGSGSGVIVNYSPASVQSFTIPGLVAVDTRLAEETTGSVAQSVLVHPSGSPVYVRGSYGVAVYAFDPATAILGPEPAFSFPSGPIGGFFGMDQIAIDPAGERVYLPHSSYPTPGVDVRSAVNGDLLGTITHPDMGWPTGVCLAPAVDRDDDGLSDAREAALGTDPTNPDSDGDGLLDGFEAGFGLNPRAADGSLDPDGD